MQKEGSILSDIVIIEPPLYAINNIPLSKALGPKCRSIAFSFCSKCSKKCHSISIPKIILFQCPCRMNLYIFNNISVQKRYAARSNIFVISKNASKKSISFAQVIWECAPPAIAPVSKNSKQILRI